MALFLHPCKDPAAEVNADDLRTVVNYFKINTKEPDVKVLANIYVFLLSFPYFDQLDSQVLGVGYRIPGKFRFAENDAAGYVSIPLTLAYNLYSFL